MWYYYVTDLHAYSVKKEIRALFAGPCISDSSFREIIQKINDLKVAQIYKWHQVSDSESPTNLSQAKWKWTP